MESPTTTLDGENGEFFITNGNIQSTGGEAKGVVFVDTIVKAGRAEIDGTTLDGNSVAAGILVDGSTSATVEGVKLWFKGELDATGWDFFFSLILLTLFSLSFSFLLLFIFSFISPLSFNSCYCNRTIW